MRFGVSFILLGVCWLVLALTYRGLAWLLLWPAVSFLAVGAAYLGIGARVFGKRPDGSMSPVHLLILLPYVFLAWGVWALLALFSNEPPAHEVAPGIGVSRRLGKRELPAGVDLILDLTCELWEPRAVRTACAYVSFPTLDAGIPELEKLLEKIRSTKGSILIHCAQGHGRSALIAACLLLDRRIVTDAEDAIGRIAAVRAGVRISRSQRRALVSFCPRTA